MDEAKQAVEEDEDDDDALTPDSQKSWPRLPRCGSSKTLEALQVGEEGAQIAAGPGSTTAAEQVTNAASEVLVSAEEQHGRVEPGSSAGVALRGESHARVESEIRAEAVKDGSAGGNVMAVPLRQLAFDYSLPSSDASSQGGVPLSAAGDQGVGIPGSSWLPPPPVSETQLQKGVDDWTDAVSQGVEAGHENLLQQLDLIVPASSDACQAPQNTLPTPHLQAAAGKEGTQHGQVDADKTGLQHDGQVMAAMPLAPGEEDDEEQIMLAALEMAERQLCAASSSRGKTCAPDVVSPALAANEPSSPQPPQPVPQDASRMAGGADAQGSKCCAHVSKTAGVDAGGGVRDAVMRHEDGTCHQDAALCQHASAAGGAVGTKRKALGNDEGERPHQWAQAPFLEPVPLPCAEATEVFEFQGANAAGAAGGGRAEEGKKGRASWACGQVLDESLERDLVSLDRALGAEDRATEAAHEVGTPGVEGGEQEQEARAGRKACAYWSPKLRPVHDPVHVDFDRGCSQAFGLTLALEDVPFVGDVSFVECADRARHDAALGVCLVADEGEEKGMDLPAAAVQEYSQEAETRMCHCGSGVCVSKCQWRVTKCVSMCRVCVDSVSRMCRQCLLVCVRVCVDHL